MDTLSFLRSQYLWLETLSLILPGKPYCFENDGFRGKLFPKRALHDLFVGHTSPLGHSANVDLDHIVS